MRRLFSLLLIVSVLWCGLHLSGSPEQVGAPAAIGQSIAADDHDAGKDSEKAAHAAHHHCPSAMSPRVAGVDCPVGADERLLFAPPAARLASRTPSPPIEPPLA